MCNEGVEHINTIKPPIKNKHEHILSDGKKSYEDKGKENNNKKIK